MKLAPGDTSSVFSGTTQKLADIV